MNAPRRKQGGHDGATATGRRWHRVAGVAALLVFAGLLPDLLSSFYLQRYTSDLTLAIAILGLNLLAGYGGQISVGQGAFVGLGAYTTAILVASHGWPHLASLVAAAVLCFLAGIVAGVPAMRIRGIYLAMVTLALAVVFPTLVQHFSSVTGGSQGITVPAYSSPITGLSQVKWAYYLVLAFAVVLFLFIWNLVHSRVGRALVATRDNEIAGKVVGVNVGLYKVLTFAISASIAGIAGSLTVLGSQFPFVSAGVFTLGYSILLLVGTVVGGATSVAGALIGALFIDRAGSLLTSTLGLSSALTPAAFGGVLILCMIFAPGGVVGLYERGKAALLRRTGHAFIGVAATDAAFTSQAEVAMEVADRSSVVKDIEPSGAAIAPRGGVERNDTNQREELT